MITNVTKKYSKLLIWLIILILLQERRKGIRIHIIPLSFFLSPFSSRMRKRGKVESFLLPPHFPFLPNKETSSDYLFIRIRVMSTKVISLFVRRISNSSFGSVKFVFTVLIFIFWCLSLPTRNIFTFTFWTKLE